MSLSALFYLISVVGAYQLGAYTARHPGALQQRCQELWAWINQQRRSDRRN